MIGIVAASLGALGALLAVGGAYPFWALGVFALCAIVIHGLVVHDQPEERQPHGQPEEARSEPGTYSPQGS